ncbi:MAG: putative basic amino acid antiporter YfcC [Clostridiales bacterium]|nr:putative basic amino acid antiporter YfcC [Clostridiales bacterium]
MEEKKKFKIAVPHVYSLLIAIIIICALMTYIIPAGAYDMMVTEDGRSVVDPTTYHRIEQTPLSLMATLSAVFNGMMGAADIIFLIFICGGAFGVVFATKAFDAAIVRIALAMNGKEKIIIPVLMAVFCFMGCTMGSAEDLIVYVPIIMSLCLALGFDSITAVAIILVGAGAGFAGSMMNPYTEGVAQSIAGLPLFSGMGFRACILVVLFLVAVIYVWRYATKIKKDPTKSPMYEFDKTRDTGLSMNLEDNPFSIGQKIIVAAFLGCIALLVIGTLKLGWWYAEICGLFFGLGIIAAICGRMNLNQFGQAFAQGMADITTGALVVGIARGILVVLESGNIIHTLLFAAATVLQGLPGIVCAEGMYIVQCLMNYLIPSGSGQAAVTMPLMAPLADVVGVTRQTATICFQMGDGISNIFTPTSGYLMATLGMAKIPWDKWAKFIIPLIGIWYAIGAVFVGVAYVIKLGPF